MRFIFRLAFITRSLIVVVPDIVRESAQAWKERDQ